MKRRIKNVTGILTITVFLVWVLVIALQSITEWRMEWANAVLAGTMLTGAFVWLGMETTDTKN